jgi:enoyl-CoA hydratase/carnithine racemase
MTKERQYIQSTKCDGYQHIEIDYAEKKNTMSSAFFAQLRDAFYAANNDREVRAILLSGRGDIFSGGGDIQEFAKNPFADGYTSSPIYHAIDEVLRCDKPIVAAVQGAAVGGGATILLACDIVVAAEETKFLFPFAQLGINAELGSSYLLPLTVGMRFASKWLLLAEPVGSEEALQAGLATEVVPADQLMSTSMRYVTRLTELVPRSVRTNKRLLRHGHAAALQSVLVEEFKELEVGGASDELKEAIEAFKGKRKPDFSSFS